MKIYIGNTENTVRPFSMDDPNCEQGLENWELIVDEETAEGAISELIELFNDEAVDVTNSWLRLEK